MGFDNIALFNCIPTPCFGEGKSLTKQLRQPDMDQSSTIERSQSFVKDCRAQKYRFVHLLSGQSLATSLGEPPKHDSFEVV